jgi:hypothetical protein
LNTKHTGLVILFAAWKGEENKAETIVATYSKRKIPQFLFKPEKRETHKCYRAIKSFSETIASETFRKSKLTTTTTSPTLGFILLLDSSPSRLQNASERTMFLDSILLHDIAEDEKPYREEDQQHTTSSS